MDKNRIAVNIYDRIAEAYQDRFMDLDIYDHTYDAFCERLQGESPLLLEIGYGPGNITHYLKAKKPAARIIATDAAPNMIRLAAERVPGVDFRVMDARHIRDIPPELDGIVCGFCLLYFPGEECRALIASFAALLAEGGLLYISVIEGDYAASGFEAASNGRDGMYVFYYDERFLAHVLTENGLALKETIRVPFTRPTGRTDTHLVLIAAKEAKKEMPR